MRVLLLFIAFLYYSATKAQEVAITNHKQNVLYIGVSNPISIAVNKVECKDVKLIPSYGQAQITDEPCNYNITVDRPGKILLSLYTKNENQLIGELEYRVKYLPEPFTYIAGRMGGDIKKSVLNAQLGIIAKHFLHIDLDDGFLVDHFSVSIKKEGKIIFLKDVIGPYFDDDVKAEFMKLIQGDVVIFHDITGKSRVDNVVRTLRAAEYSIVE